MSFSHSRRLIVVFSLISFVIVLVVFGQPSPVLAGDSRDPQPRTVAPRHSIFAQYIRR